MRKRLLITFVIIIAIMMTTFVFIINRSTVDAIEKQYEIHFKYELNFLEHIFNENKMMLDNPNQYINNFDLSEENRITIINMNGVVLADNYENYNRMGNHSNRPEIKEAIKSLEYGVSIRRSDTLNSNMIYVAKVFNIGDRKIIVRLSKPLSEIYDLSQKNILIAVILGFITAIVTSAVGAYFSMRITKPIQELIHSSELIANGQYNKKIYVSSQDEVGKLADSFNIMRLNLSQTMSALTTRNAELQAILNSMASGIIAADINENIILINQQSFDILELPDNIVSIHDSVYKVVKHPKIIELIKSATNEGKSYVEEIVHAHIDKVLKVHVNPVRVDNREIMGTMIVIDDITQIRKLEGIRSEFVSNVTHELKTPLTSILGFVDTLKEGALNDRNKAERFLTIIETEAERLNRLISDVLLLSEIESTTYDKDRTMIELAPVIDEVVDMLAINIGNKPINLEFVTRYEVKIEANRDRIKQLIINLVDNAIKYTERGYIHVHLTHTAEFARIVIEDSGMGFDNAERVRLFERFYRIDKARSRKMGGTGLGLSIVKHIVNLYRGEINVNSIKGRGTTFTVLLPIKNEHNFKHMDS